MVELMGKRNHKINILGRKMPEIKDVPSQMKLTIFGKGSTMGEEDNFGR